MCSVINHQATSTHLDDLLKMISATAIDHEIVPTHLMKIDTINIVVGVGPVRLKMVTILGGLRGHITLHMPLSIHRIMLDIIKNTIAVVLFLEALHQQGGDTTIVLLLLLEALHQQKGDTIIVLLILLLESLNLLLEALNLLLKAQATSGEALPL